MGDRKGEQKKECARGREVPALVEDVVLFLCCRGEQICDV